MTWLAWAGRLRNFDEAYRTLIRRQHHLSRFQPQDPDPSVLGDGLGICRIDASNSQPLHKTLVPDALQRLPSPHLGRSQSYFGSQGSTTRTTKQGSASLQTLGPSLQSPHHSKLAVTLKGPSKYYKFRTWSFCFQKISSLPHTYLVRIPVLMNTGI